MSRLLISAVVCATVLFTNVDIDACSCAPPPPPKVALKQAAAVFAGKVVEIEFDQAKYTKTVTIEVASAWKGDIGKRVKVTTAIHGATCGYGFKKGGAYLVYCYANKPKGDEPVILRTNICTRTRPMATAAGDIKEIGEGKKPAANK